MIEHNFKSLKQRIQLIKYNLDVKETTMPIIQNNPSKII